jgi:flagellar hook-associated protein 2
MNTSGISFSGLISGLDTSSIIDQLMEIGRRPIELIENQKLEIQSKISAWQEVNTKLLALKSAVSSLTDSDSFRQYTVQLSDSDIFSASASSDAAAGLYTVEVLQIAAAEQVSSDSFSDTSSELGLEGKFLINGVRIDVGASDSLTDIKNAINSANAGVTAAIINVSDQDHRLVITSNQTGDEGIDLAEVSGDVLKGLGFIDNTTSLKHSLGEGAESDTFADMTSPIGTLLNLGTSPSGTVTIGDKAVSIDLATDSLQTIKDKIEAASPTGVSVAVVEDTSSGATRYKLQITGTTNFVDDNNVLQVLGILEGGRSPVSEVLTSTVSNTVDGTTPITESTTFGEIYGANVSDGDTITISGTDHDGNSVSSVYTINTSNTIRDFLDAVESAFNNTVTASIDANGRIVITDNTSGESYLSLTLVENNEGGGSLDFGSFQTTVVGRLRQLQDGTDARIKLNGIEITRSTNTIDDAIDGITLTLQKAEPGTTVSMNVSQNTGAIRTLIQNFVDAYNDFVSYVNEQFDYDTEQQQGGTLLGDTTLITVHSRIRSILIDEVSGLSGDLTALVQIGISSDSDGILSIDESTLNDALQNNLDQVINLFVARGTATGKVEYVSHTSDTNPGTYNVVITQAAEQATVVGSTSILDTGLAQDEALTITELTGGVSETVQLYAGDTIDVIVNRINSLLHRRVAQVLTADKANTTDGTTPITGDTTFAEIYGANVSDGDTITISGTNREGGTVSRTFTISDVNTTRVSDLLNEIENAFSGQVTATVDSSGKLVLTDNTPGDSDLSLQLTYNGSGNLDFGTFQVTTQGRYEIPVTASDDGGKLKLTHDNYGSRMGFSVVSDVEDLGDGSSTGIGTSLITDYGEDVAGTINGESATGDGQVLTGVESNENTAGLALRVTVTPQEVAAAGGTYQSTLTLTFGVAEQLDNLLDYLTDSTDGVVTRRQDGLQDQIEELDERIQTLEDRLEMERERLERVFVELERAMNELTTQGNYLLTQLAMLTNTNQSQSSGTLGISS